MRGFSVGCAESVIIRPLIPPEKPGGRHRSVNMREVLHDDVLLNFREHAPESDLPVVGNQRELY